MKKTSDDAFDKRRIEWEENLKGYGLPEGARSQIAVHMASFDPSRCGHKDNFRLAVAGDPEQVEAYRLARQRGCCGFSDELVIWDNTFYLVGFNYGH